MTAAQLKAWAAKDSCRIFAFRVSDRFGDEGLTGVIGTEVQDATLHIVHFIASCRVMGRGIEAAMIGFAIGYAHDLSLKNSAPALSPRKK